MKWTFDPIEIMTSSKNPTLFPYVEYILVIGAGGTQ